MRPRRADPWTPLFRRAVTLVLTCAALLSPSHPVLAQSRRLPSAATSQRVRAGGLRASLLRRGTARGVARVPVAPSSLHAVPTAPHLFARAPLEAGEHLPAAYHANAIEAATGFAHWLDATPEISGASLRRATEVMHATSAVGRGPTPRPYQTRRYSTDAIRPGQLRGPGAPRYNRPGAVAYTERVAALLGIPRPADGPLAVRGISDPSDRPYNIGAQHFYPRGEGLDHYFASAADSLRQLRALPVRPETRGTAENLIADYTHTLVNARPFDQINNSLVMNQVNLLLRLRGHSGIAHGHLDFLAHHLDPTAFRVAFRAQLTGHVPSPAQVGIEHLR